MALAQPVKLSVQTTITRVKTATGEFVGTIDGGTQTVEVSAEQAAALLGQQEDTQDGN